MSDAWAVAARPAGHNWSIRRRLWREKSINYRLTITNRSNTEGSDFPETRVVDGRHNGIQKTGS